MVSSPPTWKAALLSLDQTLETQEQGEETAATEEEKAGESPDSLLLPLLAQRPASDGTKCGSSDALPGSRLVSPGPASWPGLQSSAGLPLHHLLQQAGRPEILVLGDLCTHTIPKIMWEFWGNEQVKKEINNSPLEDSLPALWD